MFLKTMFLYFMLSVRLLCLLIMRNLVRISIIMFLKIMGYADGNANSFSNNLIGGTSALSLGTNATV
jgi:hypothetical protein